MVLKFCANISFMFAESGNLLERYQLAKKAGFRGVECAYPAGFTFDEVVAAKREANIAQVLLNTCNGMCLDKFTFIMPLTRCVAFAVTYDDPQKTSWAANSAVRRCPAKRMSSSGTSRRLWTWRPP